MCEWVRYSTHGQIDPCVLRGVRNASAEGTQVLVSDDVRFSLAEPAVAEKKKTTEDGSHISRRAINGPSVHHAQAIKK